MPELSTISTISLVVVAHNEAGCLPLLLKDIAAQDYPHELIELLLIDSASSDETHAIMLAFKNSVCDCISSGDTKRQGFLDIKIISNPRKSLASGCNIALNAYSCEAFVRIDAHARIPKDFISSCISVLNGSNSNNVKQQYCCGGPRPTVLQQPTPWREVLLLAEESAFGSSPAKYRQEGTSLKQTYVNSVFHGCYRREVFANVGNYNERLLRTEDNDMSWRIRSFGYKICYDPSIRSQQYVRASLRSMLRQKSANGFWIGRTLGISPHCISLMHLVPMFFVLALLIGSVLFFSISALPLAVLFFAYFLAAVVMSCRACLTMQKVGAQEVGKQKVDAQEVGKQKVGAQKNLRVFALPLIFFLIHVSYGVSTLIGIASLVKLIAPDNSTALNLKSNLQPDAFSNSGSTSNADALSNCGSTSSADSLSYCGPTSNADALCNSRAATDYLSPIEINNYLEEDKLPLISVIIPVYNVQSYLRRCIDSVLAQTYRNLQIILVDDGSTDDSGTICEQYAAIDNRIVVVHRKNGGLSVARNTGLAIAKGSYIAFVDSDDWLASDMYSYLYGLIVKHDCDIAECKYEIANSSEHQMSIVKPKEEVFANKDILKEFLRRNEYGFWMRLYARHTVMIDATADSFTNNNVEKNSSYDSSFPQVALFDAGRINEDIAAGYIALSHAKRMVFSNLPKYYYFFNVAGITSSPLRKKDFDLLFACERLDELSKMESGELRALAELKINRAPFTLLVKMALFGCSSELDERTTAQQLLTMVRENRNLLLASSMPKNRKMMLRLACRSYPLLKLTARLYRKFFGAPV
ncbi:MAG: glycosyltransferase [Coriobacteriales bacterium]|nr:glycosyltransferase [Coriobacteriales bacterium]